MRAQHQDEVLGTEERDMNDLFSTLLRGNESLEVPVERFFSLIRFDQ
jgi:hypothetical protein